VRLTGGYSRASKIKANGNPAVRLRANGAYTIIHGILATGVEYQILKEAVSVEVTNDSLKWFEDDEHTHTPPAQSAMAKTRSKRRVFALNNRFPLKSKNSKD